MRKTQKSEAVAANSLGELEVASHDGDTTSMNCTKVCVFEEGDEVGLCGFLKGQHC